MLQTYNQLSWFAWQGWGGLNLALVSWFLVSRHAVHRHFCDKAKQEQLEWDRAGPLHLQDKRHELLLAGENICHVSTA